MDGASSTTTTDNDGGQEKLVPKSPPSPKIVVQEIPPRPPSLNVDDEDGTQESDSDDSEWGDEKMAEGGEGTMIAVKNVSIDGSSGNGSSLSIDSALQFDAEAERKRFSRLPSISEQPFAAETEASEAAMRPVEYKVRVERQISIGSSRDYPTWREALAFAGSDAEHGVQFVHEKLLTAKVSGCLFRLGLLRSTLRRGCWRYLGPILCYILLIGMVPLSALWGYYMNFRPLAYAIAMPLFFLNGLLRFMMARMFQLNSNSSWALKAFRLLDPTTLGQARGWHIKSVLRSLASVLLHLIFFVFCVVMLILNTPAMTGTSTTATALSVSVIAGTAYTGLIIDTMSRYFAINALTFSKMLRRFRLLTQGSGSPRMQIDDFEEEGAWANFVALRTALRAFSECWGPTATVAEIETLLTVLFSWVAFIDSIRSLRFSAEAMEHWYRSAVLLNIFVAALFVLHRFASSASFVNSECAAVVDRVNLFSDSSPGLRPEVLRNLRDFAHRISTADLRFRWKGINVPAGIDLYAAYIVILLWLISVAWFIR
eukprot:g4168.t1